MAGRRSLAVTAPAAGLFLCAGIALIGGCGAASGSGAQETTFTAAPAASGAAPTTLTTTAPAPALPLRGRVVTVDPGHNGGNASHPAAIARPVWIGTGFKECDTAGAATSGGYAEPAYNFDVARRLARLLRQAGARAVLTRHDNRGVGPCINRRARIGNRARSDAAISIHADGGPPGGRGFHVIYPAPVRGLPPRVLRRSARLALAVRAAYRHGTGMPYATYIGRSGLDRRGDLGGLNLTRVPKVFVETGNMRNARDAARLTSARFRERAARALLRGIERYLG